MSHQPLLIAHRGGAKEAPENTFAAINHALALGVHCVEIDVRLSKEGIPIVLHDPSAARVSGNPNSPHISQLTLPQIKKIDVGQHFGISFTGESIPTLLDILNLNWGQTGLMIEIKKGRQDPKLLTDAVFDALSKAKNLPPWILIGSFSDEIMHEVRMHKKRKDFKIALMGIVEKPEMIGVFVTQKIKHLALWYRLISPDLIRPLKEKEIEVWSFTVDDVNVAKFLISLGINGIISNVPEMMLTTRIFHLH